MHSSTVTVAVLDPSVVSFTVNDADIKLEWFSGTGKGGQHRNKHQTSCRLIHLPTGIVCTSQTRSRDTSYREAREALETRVAEVHMSSHQRTQAITRRLQVGSGERGDKVRTYRFQDGTAKDHRTGAVIPLSRFMSGDIQLLW